jgi:HEPN domain-containing protein
VSAEIPLDDEEFARWRRDADRALESARVQSREGVHNWACFAAEQASQLALRLRRLGRHYIPARYPDTHASGGASEHYEEEESTEAVADAEAVLAFVDSAWEEACEPHLREPTRSRARRWMSG